MILSLLKKLENLEYQKDRKVKESIKISKVFSGKWERILKKTSTNILIMKIKIFAIETLHSISEASSNIKSSS